MPFLTVLAVLVFTPASSVPDVHAVAAYPSRQQCHVAANNLHALVNKSAFRRELFICQEDRS